MSDPFAELPKHHFGAILADPPWHFEMTEIRIEIRVKPWKQGDRGLRFEAWLGLRKLCTSETPFLDSARMLLQEGYSSKDQLVAVRENGVIALMAPLGVAAAHTVSDATGPPRLVTYRPYPKKLTTKQTATNFEEV